MFDKVRDKIRYLIVGIGSIILVISFLVVYFVVRANIEITSKESLDSAIQVIVDDTSGEAFKETDVMIFAINDNKVTHYNDNYLQYKPEILFELYQNCKDMKNNPLAIGLHHFYYDIISLDGQYFYFVYDASLAMAGLKLLAMLLLAFFVLLVSILVLVGIYVSNKIVDPLEKTYASQKQFMENASHELKTPLTIINANVDSLTNVSEENKKWISNIKGQTDRMNSLVMEILELFRIENQASVENKEIVNLSNYLKKTILSFEVLTFEKNITLNQKIEDNISIKCRESNVDKMINILLDNALKYVSKNGYINIELKKEKKKISLIVENSGGNLQEEDLDKIFDRFYKKNEEDSKSFGLGLAILKAIVLNLNGDVNVECKKDEYTKFIIKI